MAEKPKNFITITQGMGGIWFAVMYWWNPDMGGFWEPWDTGFGRYVDKSRAIEEGQLWADNEGLEFVMPKAPD